ncbi:MAG: hypothetical protein PHD25_12715, partial [Bacteroidales bacterium]|nr:hypothetical protein [Bacteroidales bacterium]
VDNSEKVNNALSNGYGVMSLSYNGSSPKSIVIDTATLKTVFGGGGGGGDVYKVGTPINNQVGVWTGDGTIEGDGDLTFDGSKLTSNKLFISSPTTGSTDYDKFLVLDVSGTEVKTRTGSQVLSDIGAEAAQTKGNLTEDVTGLQFDNTRQVIGGAAKLSLTSGYAIPTTIDQTNWNQAHTHVHNDADTLITNEGKLDLESGSNKVMITSNTSGSPKLTLKGGDNVTITTMNDTATITAEGGGGGGDMYKSVYDTDGDNIVDNSEKVNNALSNGYGVMSLSYNGSSPKSIVIDTATLKTVFGGSDGDGSITNEGKLDLESGSNKVMITSNTSGSPKLTLKGGDNVTITTTNDTATITAEGGGGGGDMYKSVYDTDGDNTVDNSEKVNSALTNGYGVISLSYDGSAAKSILIDTATLKTVFGGGEGDNLGNHQASQTLDMNSYDITEGDDINCQTLKATAGDGMAESAIEASSNGSRTTAIIERKTTSFYGIEYPLQLQAYGTSSNSDGQGVGTKYLGKDDAGNWETIGEYHVAFPENGNGKERANMVWQLNSAGSLSSEMTLTPDSLIIQGLRVTGGTVRLPSLSSATSSNTLYVQANGLITKGAATSGTVTNVAMTVPESELGVSGTPITTAGTLALSWDTQTINKVFASPNSSTGVPTFRALVDNDIPNDITCSNYEPLLTKYTLSLGTGLTFSSGEGAGRILGGAATIGIANTHYLPLLADQTNWNQAHSHVHNDADTLTSNEVQGLNYTASTRILDISLSASDVTLPLFEAATTNAGLSPGGNNKGATYFLNAEGSWAVPSGTAHPQTYTLAGGSGLSVDAGVNRLHGGNSTISIASGYYLPQTTDQTNWNQAHSHVHNDADTVATNEIQNLSW